MARRGGGALALAIDTGMSRTGVRWDEVDELRGAIATCPPEGAYTHFHSAELNDPSLEQQEQRFRDAVAALPERPRILHVENSAAVALRDKSGWDCVRPGIFLYGVASGSGARLHPEPSFMFTRESSTFAGSAMADVSYDSSTAPWANVASPPLGLAMPKATAIAFQQRRGRCSPVAACEFAGVVTMDMTMVTSTRTLCV